MKLGSETGSFVNHLYSRSSGNAPEPEIGMGATILLWTDRHAATVTEVNGKVITVQQDIAKRIDKNGMSDMQDYEYERDPNGIVYNFRKNKNGKWDEVRFNEETGRWNKINGGSGISIGFRREYYDFSF